RVSCPHFSPTRRSSDLLTARLDYGFRVAGNDRFTERLGQGPPIVADGGMGSLITAAVPRLRTPEEANLRAPEAVVSLHVGFINRSEEHTSELQSPDQLV